MCNVMCGDNRFEVIAKAKDELVSATNIEDSPDEMAVIDSILFRCWQMGWLDAKDKARDVQAENEKLRELFTTCADSFVRDAALNNGDGPYYSGEDWLELANEMRLELAECCGELGIEMR